MTYERKFEVKSKACQRFADLAGIRVDLKLCIRACDELLAISPRIPHVPSIAQEALAEYAIFRYCRTISSGVRTGIAREQIDLLPGDLTDLHDYFKSIRDKHLAHSVNYDEENLVQATISLDPNATLVNLGTHHLRRPVTGHEKIGFLKELACAVFELVQKDYQTERETIWKLLEDMSPEERLSLSNIPKPDPQLRPAHVTRPKAGGC